MPDEQSVPRLAVIGAGKVGATLARLAHAAGYRVSAVYSPTTAHAADLAARVDAQVAGSAEEALHHADLVLLTVPDDAIGPVAASLRNADWQGRALVHTSGAASLDVLEPVAAAGAMTGSLHPAFPFADVEQSVRELPGAAFALESSHEHLRGWLHDLVSALHGQVIDIPPGGKARYHAALVIASNYSVILYAAAQRLLASLGADDAASSAALQTLMTATLHNIAQQGIPWALTGPLTRLDLGTIQKHLAALDDEVMRTTYRDLARLGYPVLKARGLDVTAIEMILGQDEDHAFNNS